MTFQNGRRRERAKTLLLIILSCSAAVLLYLTIRVEGSLWLVGGSNPSAGTKKEFHPVSPLYLVVSAGGDRQLLQGGGASAYYDRLLPVFEEAAGSARAPAQVDGAAFQTALAGPGILLGYGGRMPMAALFSGDSALTGRYADLILLSAGENGVVLYGRDLADGLFFAAETGLRGQDLSLGDAVGGRACRLAYEEGELFSFLPADAPLLFEPLTARLLTAAPLLTGNDQNAWVQTALTALAADPYTARPYHVEGGRVYLSDYGSILFGNDGVITYSAGDAGGIPLSVLAPSAQSYNSDSAFRAAKAAADALLEPFAAQSEGLSLRYLKVYEEGGAIFLCLGYTANGRPLLRENGSQIFAHFTVENGRMTKAELLPMAGRAEEGPPLPLFTPEILAAALGESARQQGSGAPFFLWPTYRQNGAEFLLDWCLVPILPAEPARTERRSFPWNDPA